MTDYDKIVKSVGVLGNVVGYITSTSPAYAYVLVDVVGKEMVTWWVSLDSLCVGGGAYFRYDDDNPESRIRACRQGADNMIKRAYWAY